MVKKTKIKNLPPRVILRQRDNLTGSYPTIARTGDNRTGKYSSFFDDSKTVDFITSSNFVSYPTTLPTASQYLKTELSSTIYTPGNVKKGIADNFVEFNNPGQQNGPFIEDGLFEQNKSSRFYLTGTDHNIIGTNFTSPLRSKTSFTVELNSQQSSSIFWSTGETVSEVNSGLSYYNFNLKRWEAIGNLSTGSSVNYVEDSSDPRATAPLAVFTTARPDIANNDNIIQNVGYPITDFGFPFASKFDATSSQLFSLTGTLSHPFLVEKMVFEFSCSMPNTGTSDESQQIYSLYVLNQFNNPQINKNITIGMKETINNGASLVTNAVTHSVGKSKDFVGYGLISVINHTPSTARPASFFERDLTISGTNYSSSGITGTFTLEFTPRIPKITDIMGWHRKRNDDSDLYAVKSEFGGANNIFNNTDVDRNVSGRNYIASVSTMGSESQKTTFSTLNENIVGTSDHFSVSPYILSPEDKLLICFCGQISDIEAQSARHPFIFNGPARIKIYGSLIKDKSEYHDTLNQPLTSISVHESLFSNPSLDEYLFNPRTLFSGSYIDDVVTGTIPNRVVAGSSVSLSGFANSSAELARATSGSSFFRGVQLSEENSVIYDCLLPRLDQVFRADGVALSFSPPAIKYAFSDGSNTTFLRAAAFEPRYSDVDRGRNPIKNAQATPTDPEVDDAFVEMNNNISLVSEPTNGFISDLLLRKSVYGFSRGFYENSSKFHGQTEITERQGTAFGQAAYYNVITRGVKRGLFSYRSVAPKAIFRHDIYRGMPADMLEQRKDYKTIKDNGTIVPSPVQIKFSLPDPFDTDSQNTSFEATSSLWYEDGVPRNRSVASYPDTDIVSE